MVDKNINDLDPWLIPVAENWQTECETAGLTVRPIVTWRSASDQNRAEACGLSKAGAGQSPHNCTDSAGNPSSKAFDFGVFVSGTYITDGTNDKYAQAGAIAVALGLVWGGNWTLEKDGCEPDYDHIEMVEWKTAA